MRMLFAAEFGTWRGAEVGPWRGAEIGPWSRARMGQQQPNSRLGLQLASGSGPTCQIRSIGQHVFTVSGSYLLVSLN
jgi:hypothetical protein